MCFSAGPGLGNLFMGRDIMGNKKQSGGETTAAVAPVTPAQSPAPTIQPSAVEGRASDEERRQKLSRMRNGLASTIKTSAKGLTGSGSDLLTQTILGKDKLGA